MPKIDWNTFYTDLPDNIASILRGIRVKPDQLKAKADGEILAIEGISDADLETIRALYPANTIIETEAKEEAAKDEKPTEEKKTKKAAKAKKHSTRYTAMTKLVDKNKAYSPSEATTIIAQLASKRRTSTIELHLNVREVGLRGEAKLNHSTGKVARIEIFSDKTVVKLNDNIIDFDILLATPADMPKLARFAKTLGPKGLMPNPKTGTITPDPEKRATELASGATLSYKSEPKFPIIHLNLGPATQKVEDLTDNLNSVIREIGASKIISAFLTSTQTPSVKLDLSSYR